MMQTDPDRQIFETVMDELSWDRRVCAVDIQVQVDAGCVVLSGSVPDVEQSLCAQAVVKLVPGVRSVHSRLRIECASDGRAHMAIARRIHAALSGLGYVNSEAIQVRIEGGWVKLSGLVGTKAQRQHLVWMLQKLLGIREVMEIFAVASPSCA